VAWERCISALGAKHSPHDDWCLLVAFLDRASCGSATLAGIGVNCYLNDTIGCGIDKHQDMAPPL